MYIERWSTLECSMMIHVVFQIYKTNLRGVGGRTLAQTAINLQQISPKGLLCFRCIFNFVVGSTFRYLAVLGQNYPLLFNRALQTP